MYLSLFETLHSPQYTQVRGSSDEDSERDLDLNSKNSEQGPDGSTYATSAHMKMCVCLNALFFCLSIFLFGTSMLSDGCNHRHEERNYFLKQTSEPCNMTSVQLH